MTTLQVVLFLVGLVALVAGAELLVRGASRLAAAFGVSPLVVGLTIVAYGTSAPEMAVSIQSAWAGQADLALGNVVGSNIFNVLFILGISAAITPLAVDQKLVRREVPLLIGLSIATWLMCLDGSVNRIEGLVLFGGAIAYTAWLIVESRREKAEIIQEYADEFAEPKSNTLANLALIAVGLGLLVLGSRWLVDGAVAFARVLGVSELVIGLTVVAAGTSLPEVATSIVAAMRGERDIAVGNVVGSNLFNLMAVLGLASAVSPNGVAAAAAAIAFDLPVMIGVSVACLPILFTGHRIDRWEGFLFLAYYLAYTGYLVLGATAHDAQDDFAAVMGWFVIPLTAVTLAILGLRAWRARHVQVEE